MSSLLKFAPFKKYIISGEYLCDMCMNGNWDDARVLITAGVDVNVPSHGLAALWWAASHGNLEIVQMLLEKGAALEANELESTPLHEACSNSKEDVARFLLAQGANIRQFSRTTRRTAFSTACHKGLYDTVHAMLEQKAHELSEQESVDGMLCAVEGGYKDIVQLIVEKTHININLLDSYGRNGLVVACTKGLFKTAELLIRLGADVHVASGNWPFDTALLGCFRQFVNLELIELLLERGADVSRAGRTGEATALHLAAAYRESDALIRLLDRVQDDEALNTTDRAGNTPLHFAGFNNRLENAKHLVTRGALPEAANEAGLLPSKCFPNPELSVAFQNWLNSRCGDYVLK